MNNEQQTAVLSMLDKENASIPVLLFGLLIKYTFLSISFCLAFCQSFYKSKKVSEKIRSNATYDKMLSIQMSILLALKI